MPPILLLIVLLIPASTWAAEEHMPQMPRIEPKKVFVVPSQDAGEALLEDRGFGEEEDQVRMMNLMMVEGSGFEGMDMTQSEKH